VHLATRANATGTVQNRPVSHIDVTWLLFDFSDPAAAADWNAIDDRVMGGVSSSRLRHDPAGHAIFDGIVSLERNGGFASIRSTPGNRGKRDAQTCFIEARATGKRYKLNLLTDDAFDSVNYQASFTPEPDWQTLHIPLASFRATFRGREVPGAPALDPARIRQVGLMIAERQAGLFVLEVRRIGLA
jgi:NADH dehydrogenase [ubiquinone] 1 alpha subcomplex assembly factor 1